jgi:hypothetical protein
MHKSLSKYGYKAKNMIGRYAPVLAFAQERKKVSRELLKC